MASRRQEKVGRVVKEAVYDAIANHLSDPRITGFISVTRVEMSPDLRSSEIYLSIFGGDEKSQKRTYMAIEHAKNKIQSLVAKRITGKFCPVLHFHMDENFKKTLETLRAIDEATSDLKHEDAEDFEGGENNQS